MTYQRRVCTLIVAIALIATTASGCSAACRAEAGEQISQLKRIVPQLLPDSVAVTMEEGDDCDSGTGGYLHFTADVDLGDEKIVEKFISQGWDRINPSECGDCTGVTTRWNDETVNVTLSESGIDPPVVKILAEFGS